MHSPTIGKIAESLAKAQVAFRPAVKDASNPFFKSKYVDLAGALEAIREALSKNQLALIQTTEITEKGIVLNSQLIHASGEWLGSAYPVKPVKDDPQGMGSALTYARRYSLMALVGIAAEDDDGEAASGRAQKVASTTGEVVKKIPAWHVDQQTEVGSIFKEIHDLGGEAGEKDVQALRAKMKYDQPTDVIDAASVLLRKWQESAEGDKK